jgi:hypothetical protein
VYVCLTLPLSGICVETIGCCGVKQAKTTITYRLSQPGEAMLVILPRSYNAGAVPIPTELNTIAITSAAGGSV